MTPESVEIDGKPHALRDIWKLLSYEEPLQPHYQERVDRLFGKRQWGYGRTAYNLWHSQHAGKVQANRAPAIAALQDTFAPRPRHDGFRERGFDRRVVEALTVGPQR
jgi:hypothetical protein